MSILNSLNNKETSKLVSEAVAWAESHGVVMRSNSEDSSSVTHAPLSLFPFEVRDREREKEECV